MPLLRLFTGGSGPDPILASKLLYIRQKGQDMRQSLNNIVGKCMAAVTLGYKIARGVDYRTLSQYILKINQYKDINAILYEVSRCLKDILDYELFGFVLKNEEQVELWVDPRAHGQAFVDLVAREGLGQKNDCIVHYFEPQHQKKSQHPDAIDMESLISYEVMEGDSRSRLYLLPRKKILAYHDSIIQTIISSIRIALENSLCIQELENAAALDPLTNCYNRRALTSFIESDIAYARRNQHDLSAIMFDLDDFKAVNDLHGHYAGDRVLKDICALVSTMVRKSDYLARYGGEEFVLVLPDTSLHHAVNLAEKLRRKVSRHATTLGGKEIPVTASFGVASLRSDMDSSGLLREADQRLYQAKASGKNNVFPGLPAVSFEADELPQSRRHVHVA